MYNTKGKKKNLQEKFFLLFSSTLVSIFECDENKYLNTTKKKKKKLLKQNNEFISSKSLFKTMNFSLLLLVFQKFSFLKYIYQISLPLQLNVSF